MHVLQLVTSEGPFFDQYVHALEDAGITCTVVPVPRPTSGERSVLDYLRFYSRVLTTVARTDFDLVHANYGTTAPFSLLQPIRPVVISLWGTDLFGPYATVSKLAAKYADAVIVMSEEMATELGRPCRIIPHGIDFDLFTPKSKLAAQRAVGWDPAIYHVLFPYSPERAVKDYSRAERVVEQTRNKVSSPIELHWLSGVPHEQMPEYMNAADVVLVTSKHEGSPNSVREALACNVPVVSTDVGDVRKWVEDTTYSAVGSDDDELVAALARALDGDRPDNGRDAVRDTRIEKMVQKHAQTYRAVINDETVQPEAVSDPV